MAAHRQRVQLVVCGHPPPLRLTDADELEPLAPVAFATPLGMHPDLHLSTFSVRAGDRLLFFTDGLLEAGLQLTADELLDRLRAHTRRRLDDDVALLLIELTLTESADETPDEHPWSAAPCRLAAR